MKKFFSLLTVAALGVSLAPAALAQVPQGDPTDLPVFSKQVPAGGGSTTEVPGPAPVAKTIDGNISDWVGTPTRYGGTSVYSAGEFVYQDHIFDATGPDDGRDAERLGTTDPLEEVFPEAYRLDALSQANAAGELGIPVEDVAPQYSWDDTYGDASPRQDAADLEEVRVAVDGDSVDLLARTTTMNTKNDTALLVLADTVPGVTSHEVPFNSGLTTTTGDVAFFVTDGTTLVADLATGDVSPAGGSAVAKPDSWTNALEASLPLASMSGTDGISLALASGTPNDDDSGFKHLTIEFSDAEAHPNVANVAFRTSEPVRIWFDRDQALALHSGSIDGFFTSLDTGLLAAGTSQEYVPGPGYHDRIFVSDPATGVPSERGQDGIFQHYGVFLPSSYATDPDQAPEPAPLQWWLHWRGGSAHSGAAVVPKVFKQFGEDRDSIVVAPSGRGSSTWYVGRGHVDILQVWKDVFDTFVIDRDHVYVTGHSMGGWGSYLLALLYPDRFAAASPVAGPVTQGAWTGVPYFEGCDDFKFDDYTPCYIEANGSRPRDQHTLKLLENARHVPMAILHGTDDELVPVSGVTRQTERLAVLGYRYRYYLSPGYEHYSHPIADQWAEAASYMHSFARPENPQRVTYVRDMPFEIATEEVQSNGAALDFDFDSAYWMSGLIPANDTTANALFDGKSLAISEVPKIVAPDTAAPTAPGQTGPYVVTGLQWLDDPSGAPATQNAFEITLLDAKGVQLDLERMSLDVGQEILGTVHALNEELALRLDGGWSAAPTITVDGQPVPVSLSEGVAEVTIPSGVHTVSIAPDGVVGAAPSSLHFTSASATSAQYSDSAVLEAQLTGHRDHPLSGETVTFSLGGATVSGVTNSEGVATATVPVDEAPGERSVSVTYGGRSDEISPAIDAASFLVTEDDSVLDLAVATQRDTSTVSATLTDADSATGLSGRTVRFLLNGGEVATAVTDASGNAVATFTKKGPKRKSEVVKAVFEGDGYYKASSVERPRRG